MRPSILNALTPWGWGAAVLAALFILVATAGGLGFRWDLFGSQRAKADAYETIDHARVLEAAGQADQAIRTDTYHREVITIQTQAAQTEAQLRSLPDADNPIDPGRLDRLRAADRELCASSPRICASLDATARR